MNDLVKTELQKAALLSEDINNLSGFLVDGLTMCSPSDLEANKAAATLILDLLVEKYGSQVTTSVTLKGLLGQVEQRH